MTSLLADNTEVTGISRCPILLFTKSDECLCDFLCAVGLETNMNLFSNSMRLHAEGIFILFYFIKYQYNGKVFKIDSVELDFCLGNYVCIHLSHFTYYKQSH